MSVNPPCGMIAVTDPLSVVPVIEVSAAGLYHIAEPSAQGIAAATPPRPMLQAPSSLTANPWAVRDGGMAANTKSAYRANRRIRRISGDEKWGDGGTGWLTVPLAPTLVKPMRE